MKAGEADSGAVTLIERLRSAVNLDVHPHCIMLEQAVVKHLGEVFRRLAAQRESRVEEGHLIPDHVYMMQSIPPKYAVSQVVGFSKWKSAIHLARMYGERKRDFIGQHLWARGYFVSTVGRDEAVIRACIKKLEDENQRLDQPGLWR